jgi:uncharacterized membrane protein YdcZ (DUF606 family)
VFFSSTALLDSGYARVVSVTKVNGKLRSSTFVVAVLSSQVSSSAIVDFVEAHLSVRKELITMPQRLREAC